MYIRDRILTVHNGSRIDARRVLFLIMNKEPHVGIDVTHEAEALRSDGVEIFVLYLDPKDSADEATRDIASEPAKSHFISLRDFQGVGSLAYMARGTGEAENIGDLYLCSVCSSIAQFNTQPVRLSTRSPTGVLGT